VLEEPDVEQAIDADLATLVTDAVDERLQLDEMFRRLPPLTSRLELHVGESFFNTEFAPAEREVLAQVQEGRSLGEVLDAVAVPDLEILRFIERMSGQGILELHRPEHRIHVVTDSICDLLPDVARRLGITIVPLSVVFGSRVLKDGIDLQPDEFYRMLTTSADHPVTSPPSKGDFLETYRRLVATGDIVSVHISAKQSETVANAEAAVREGATELAELRREAGESTGPPVIRVVDSKVNSVGLGMMAVFAVRMVRRGLGVDEIVSRLESIRERIHFLFIVDTLRYLQKGGRIGKAQALLGSLLGIKPILAMQDGEVVPVDRVRGGRKVQPRLIELFKERIDPGRPVFAALAHAVAPKWVERLRELLCEELQLVELTQGEIGPVVGTHVGPGCVGCILFQPDEAELELLAPEG
jgi:DegV family protein with EDD domain